MTRIAAIDIGSNSVLMCVGEPLGAGDYKVIYESARTTRLGQGLDRHGRLSSRSIRRTIAALEECRRKAQILGVGIARAVATAAVRESENPEDFVEPAEEALGFPVKAISGEREAELTFLGVMGPASDQSAVLLDVGGASSEIIVAERGKIIRSESIPVGAVRLKESIPSEDVLRFFVRVIEVIPTDLTPAHARDRRVIAVGGTATTLAAIRVGMKIYDPERIEGTTFTREELAGLVDRIRDLPLEERMQIPGLPPNRADIITSGGLVLLQILEDLDVDTFAVSARGLPHGLLTEMTRRGE